MDNFLEKYNLPKLNEEAAESLNRPITADEIEAVIKKFLAHKSSGPDGCRGEFYKIFKEEQPLYFSDYSKKSKKRENFHSFYKASIILIPKPEKDTTKKENFRPITDEYRRKNSQQNIGKPHPAIH